MAKKKPTTAELSEEVAGIGHNSLSSKDLKNIVERAESILEEKKVLSEDLKELFVEAKSKGFDNRTVKEVIKYRALDQEVREERQALLDMYLSALGLL